MAVRNPVTFIQDGHHSAETLRLAINQFMTRNEGVGGLTDLQVSANGTTSISVASGDALISGDDSAFQGMYHMNNTGAVSVPVTATGGTSRKDLVVARVVDPQYTGSRTGDTNAGSVEILTGTSTTRPTLPNTAIPLAWIDIPSSTSLITQAMLTEKRVLANARRFRFTQGYYPGSSSISMPGGLTSLAWPGASPGFSLAIPSWCSFVTMTIFLSGMSIVTAPAQGAIRASIGGTSGLMQGITTGFSENISNSRASYTCGVYGYLPTAYRGTTQNFWLLAQHVTGTVVSDQWTNAIFDIEFVELI